MRQYRSSTLHCATHRAAAAIWMMLLICLSAGCAKRVEYVNGDHKLTRLKQGQAAPRTGVLISEGYLAEIYTALGQPKPPVISADSNTAPPASFPKPALTLQATVIKN